MLNVSRSDYHFIDLCLLVDVNLTRATSYKNTKTILHFSFAEILVSIGLFETLDMGGGEVFRIVGRG